MEPFGPQGWSEHSRAEYKNLGLKMGAKQAASTGLKRLGRKADNSPTYTAKLPISGTESPFLLPTRRRGILVDSATGQPLTLLQAELSY